MIQPLLVPVNGTKADLHANYVKDADGMDQIEIYWGCSLLQTMPADPKLFEYRMIVGLLYNLRFSLENLEKFFNTSAKTIRRWGNALRSGFPDELCAVFLGSRGLGKLSEDVRNFIRVRYLELKDSVNNYRITILGEVARYFGKNVSGELLRQLFREADEGETASDAGVSENSATGDFLVSLSENSSPQLSASSVGGEIVVVSGLPAEIPDKALDAVVQTVDQEVKPDGWNTGFDAEKVKSIENIRIDSCSPETDNSPSPRHNHAAGNSQETDIPRNLSPRPSSGLEYENDSKAPAEREDPCGKPNGPNFLERESESGNTSTSAAGPGPVTEVESNTARGSFTAPTVPFRSESPFESWIDRVPDEPFFTHHAGLHLISAAVEKELWPYPPIVRQTFWQILAGAVCQEQGKRVDPEGISILAGKFISDIDYQRYLLSEAAEPGLIESLYRLNLKFTRVGKSRFLYFDPHTEVYTGIMKMLKDWCGGLKGVSKAIHMDFIHTEFGEPCFTRHTDGCHDMRDRFHLCSSYFKTEILGLAPDEPLIWCIDRGIWGRSSLKAIADNGDKVITWEKGYTKSEWAGTFDDEGSFTREKRKNSSSGKASVYRFKWRVKSWNGLPDGRKIIVRVRKNNGAETEVSIVTNCVSLSTEVIIWAIFNRWLQENDFKYLRTHFGIGMLVEKLFVNYADLENMEQDRPIESRAIKAMRSRKKAMELKMSAILLKLKRKFKGVPSTGQLEKEKNRLQCKLTKLRSQTDKNLNGKEGSQKWGDKLKKYLQAAKKADKATEKTEKKDVLETQIREMENELDQLEAEIKLAPQKESRLKALVEEQYVRPAFRSRALADAIKILDRNVFGHFHGQFRIAYDNYREDHVMLRMVTRAPGLLVKKGNELTVAIIPSLSLQKGAYSKIRTFVLEKSFKENSRENLPVRFKMPDLNETGSDVLTEFFLRN